MGIGGDGDRSRCDVQRNDEELGEESRQRVSHSLEAMSRSAEPEIRRGRRREREGETESNIPSCLGFYGDGADGVCTGR